MAQPNHSLRGHSVQMGNFCIEEFLLQRQTKLLGWVGVQEAPQKQGRGDLEILLYSPLAIGNKHLSRS